MSTQAFFEQSPQRLPKRLVALERATRASGFDMASDRQTGAFLRSLAALKPAGRILELGSGTGLSACWLLDGLGANGTLLTVDTDASVVALAQSELASDSRITFEIGDGGTLLDRLQAEGAQFDMIFADAWPGKYTHLEVALGLLPAGGIYLIDDMLPQPNWPPNHAEKAAGLLADLEKRPGVDVTLLAWSTGLVLVSKK